MCSVVELEQHDKCCGLVVAGGKSTICCRPHSLLSSCQFPPFVSLRAPFVFLCFAWFFNLRAVFVCSSQSSRGKTSCSECPPGTFQREAGDQLACTPCTAGRYSVLAASTACTDCGVGYACPDPDQSPKACIPGYFQVRSREVHVRGRFKHFNWTNSG